MSGVGRVDEGVGVVWVGRADEGVWGVWVGRVNEGVCGWVGWMREWGWWVG